VKKAYDEKKVPRQSDVYSWKRTQPWTSTAGIATSGTGQNKKKKQLTKAREWTKKKEGRGEKKKGGQRNGFNPYGNGEANRVPRG